MSFQIHALSRTQFEPLFALTDSELAERHAVRMRVDANPGYPCRISLADAEIGETVILVNYEHQPAESPYQSSHAIFVCEGAEQAFPAAGEVPRVLSSRLMSIRAFDRNDYMLDADVVDGSQLSELIPQMFQDSNVEYLHLHNAKRGCFAARVTRA